MLQRPDPANPVHGVVMQCLMHLDFRPCVLNPYTLTIQIILMYQYNVSCGLGSDQANILEINEYRPTNSKYSVWPFLSQFFNKTLNFLARGYTQISLMGTLIFPGGPSFPRPFVCPTLIQLAAL